MLLTVKRTDKTQGFKLLLLSMMSKIHNRFAEKLVLCFSNVQCSSLYNVCSVKNSKILQSIMVWREEILDARLFPLLIFLAGRWFWIFSMLSEYKVKRPVVLHENCRPSPYLLNHLSFVTCIKMPSLGSVKYCHFNRPLWKVIL